MRAIEVRGLTKRYGDLIAVNDLSLEVETLDSLEGFDIAHLPEPAEEFRTRIGAIRSAWVLALDPSIPLSLQAKDMGTSSGMPTIAFDAQMRNRLAMAAAAGLVIAGVAYAGVEYVTRGTRTQLDSRRRQVSLLAPELDRLEASRLTAALVGARSAALEAFATQGPRLARMLEALGKGSPGEVVITTLKVAPSIGAWKVTISGQALADTPATAQAVFNQFLRGATSSDLIGQPVRPPTITVSGNDPEVVDAAAGGGGGGQMLAKEEIAALQRPRNSIVADSWDALTPAERRTAEALGRNPQRVMIEPHWHLHPGGVPEDVVKGAAAYNEEQNSWEQLVARETGRVATPVERKAGAVLDFTVEFEVRK